MGDRDRSWEQPVRRDEAEQRSGPPDWRNLEPYEEGRAGDLPQDDRALFGDFASQLLADAEQYRPSCPSQPPSRQLRLRGAGLQATPTHSDDPGAVQEGGAPRFIGRSRSCSGASSLQEARVSAADPTLDAGRGVAEEAGPSSAAQGEASDGSGEKKESRKRGKKKLPVPDLDAIKDPNERRRQRRLVKNRNTAAASRERKQREFDDLNARTDFLTEDNAALQRMLEERDAEIARLRREISGMTGAIAGATPPGSGRSSGGPRGEPLQQRAETVSSRDAMAAADQLPQRGLTASGIAPSAVPGFIRGVDGQYLRLRPGHPLPPGAEGNLRQGRRSANRDQGLSQGDVEKGHDAGATPP